MEFFSHQIRQPDQDMLARFGGIGSQIGQFVERRRAEEERERLLNLEYAARAEAEIANRAKDEFLAVVSHELRTPLNAIVGWSSMLRRGQLTDEKVNQAIEIIDRNAKAQTQLIEDILDVSRIISGKFQLEPRPVQLPQVIDAAVESIRPAAVAKKIRINTTVGSNIGPVAGDAVRLQQVVWNLVSNAVKFSSVGGEIDVDVSGDNDDVQILVTDTGEGIPAEFLPLVFERFRQVDSSNSRRHGGLGLGLAIARHLVELHGGTVQAHSDGAGKGSVFTVKLPCMGVPQVILGPTASKVTNGRALAKKQLTDMRILSVEDDIDARTMLDTVLRDQGADVVSVSSVSEALEILSDKDSLPRVVISDLGMPVSDGYDLIRELRSRTTESGGQIPAIAISGYAANHDIQRALNAGFQMHLKKPVNWEELIAAVARFGRRA
jgi:signal transduction histidine kinase/CheY-like chemotaxis protein